MPPADHASRIARLLHDAAKIDLSDAAGAANPANEIHDEIAGLLLESDEVVAVEHRDGYVRWLGDQLEQMPLLVRQHLRWETAEQMERLARFAYILAR